MRKHFQWKFCLFLAPQVYQIKQIDLKTTHKSDLTNIKLIFFLLMFKKIEHSNKATKASRRKTFFLLDLLNLFMRS